MSPNASAITGLEPAAVWEFFAQLSAIPRPSKHEERVLQWLKEFADSRKLSHEQDAVGNLVIRRPGSGGGEAAPSVAIQGHVDMVCESNVDHDFHKDPILLEREGDWVKAKGTTLGSDNGIGVCTALALLDMPASAKLPPLECLFTVDEETGLTGAFDISPHLLKSRTMLNLDTEDWGELFIGCAGGGDCTITKDVRLEAAGSAACAAALPVTLRVDGLLGGHSGLCIHEGRGNALQWLARIMRRVLREAPGTRVVSLAGGDKRNAIPRDAQASLLVPRELSAQVAQVVSEVRSELHMEYGDLEKDMSIQLTESAPASPPPATVIASEDLDRLLLLLSLLPHGALKYSHAVKGLVETSSNLASIQPCSPQNGAEGSTCYAVVTSTRSSVGPALESVRDNISAVAGVVGATVERSKAYPGWQPNLRSQVLQVTCEAYRSLMGREAKVGAIHAGLECGILGEKFPGMDTVSFGPTIKNAHSPDERVQISTIKPFWDLTLEVLRRLADSRA